MNPQQQNPLFPVDPANNQQPVTTVVAANPAAKTKSETDARNAATELIRRKLRQLYAEEPNALEEIEEVQVIKPVSKHQRFMAELSQSGRSLAEVQTEWHRYYTTLPDEEKHEVWQEFYASSSATSQYHTQTSQWQPMPTTANQPAQVPVTNAVNPTFQPPQQPERQIPTKLEPSRRNLPAKPRSKRAIKQHIVDKVSAGGKLTTKHHVQSLVFGLSIGAAVVFIFLFSFFNEFFIAPFIQPSRHASATPLILSTDGVAPTANPEVIIPKINVELPADFTQTSTDEATIENALESGVVHYPTTVMPGQNGNTAFFGHSSNNIFNKGKYKFAFVLLHELVPGDTFYITYNSKVYVYKVITKDIVDPSDVAVLGPVEGQTATATLITCDPPGTSLRRLIIVGQQISPDPTGNTASPSTDPTTTVGPAALPGNGPSLLSRVWHSVF